MSDPSNRYAAPKASVQDPTVTSKSGLEYASRGIRFVAAMVDGLIMMAVVLAGILLISHSFEDLAKDKSKIYLAAGIAVLINLAINATLLAQRGQSIAKILFKIRILRADGSKASALRVVGLRYVSPMLIGMVPLVGALFSLVNQLLIFRPSRRCLHDDMADTIVVKV